VPISKTFSGHQRDHVRLTDRLVAVDPQRAIGICVVVQFRADELLAGNLGHRGQHSLVVDAASPQLTVQHSLFGGMKIDWGHVLRAVVCCLSRLH
jgi:hypothetical protein